MSQITEIGLHGFGAEGANRDSADSRERTDPGCADNRHRGEALVMAPELGVLGGQGGRGRTRLRALLRRRLELLPE